MLGCAAVPNGAAAGEPAFARSHVFLRGCASGSQGDRWTFSQASHARGTSALSPRESSQTSFPPDSRHPTLPMECCSAVTRDAWRRNVHCLPRHVRRHRRRLAVFRRIHRLMLCLRALQGQIGQLLAAACVSGCAGFGLRYACSCARSESTRDHLGKRGHTQGLGFRVMGFRFRGLRESTRLACCQPGVSKPPRSELGCNGTRLKHDRARASSQD
jgi:hypothetical protein